MKIRDLISHLGEKAFQDTTIKCETFEDDVFENIAFKNVKFVNCSFFNIKFTNVTISGNVRFEDCHFWEAKLSFRPVENSGLCHVKFVECRFGKECYISDVECDDLSIENCTCYADKPEKTMIENLLTIDNFTGHNLDFHYAMVMNVLVQNSNIKKNLFVNHSILSNLTIDNSVVYHAQVQFSYISNDMLIRNTEFVSHYNYAGTIIEMSDIKELHLIENKSSNQFLNTLVSLEYSKVARIVLPDNRIRKETQLRIEKSKVTTLDISTKLNPKPLLYSDDSVEYINFGEDKSAKFEDYLDYEHNKIVRMLSC